MLKRKITSVLTALLLTAYGAVPQAASSDISAAETPDVSGKLTGDVNLNGNIDIQDAVLLQEFLLGAVSLTDSQGSCADINSDGSVNVFDLVSLKRKLFSVAEKYSALLINEVCSSNKDSLKDAAGAAPDWIEIYNSSDEEIVLDGIGVSDSANKKFKFTFPENTVISGGGYVLVYCDDAVNQAEGEFHAAFKISATGETIYLTHPQFGEIGSVDVPELAEDTTYGRYANGSETFTYLTPTPGESNDSAQDITAVEKPVFSAEGGFYDAAFMLGLSDANDNTIYYTTDGSDPRTSSTARIYSGEINIYNNTGDANKYSALDDITLCTYSHPTGKVDKGIVVRAVSRTEDGKYSGVVTNSYFVGKTASYYSDMKVISLATDSDYLFGEDTGIYMVGIGYYDWLDSEDYEEYMEGDTANPTNYNKDGREWEIPVNVQVFENGKPACTADVGARIAGNWSRAFPQKSIRLYARSEYGSSDMKYEFIEGLADESGNIINSFDKVTLRNGGTDNQVLHFRDALIQDLVSDRAIDTQGSEPCIMFIDGEFWGFYFIREKIEDTYIESHYGIDKDNITVLKNGECEGSAEIAGEYEEFCKWAASADMTVPENYQKVCDTIDIQNFMDYIAIETYINNTDWATEYFNNWQMWRSNTADESIPYSDGKWRFTLYDTEYSTGLFKEGRTSSGFDTLGSLYTKDVPYNFANVFYSLIKNDTFRQEFYDNYIEIMENNFAPAEVDAKITEYVSAYRDAVFATNVRFNAAWVNSSYNDEVQNLRNFFNDRPKYAKYYLDVLVGKTSLDTGENIMPSVSSWTHYGAAAFSFDNAENSFTAKAYASAANPWDIQAQARGLTLEKGKTYRLTFEASCTSDVTMNIGIIRQSGNSYPGCWYGNPELSSDMKKYTYTVTMQENTSSDWFLFFNFGSAAGTYVIKNVSLAEINVDGAMGG
ncbi:MAG: CotH kinase family protein [Porcipelethomonas sp.]